MFLRGQRLCLIHPLDPHIGQFYVFYLVNTQYVFFVVSDDNHDNSTCSAQYGTSKKADLDNL